MIGEAFIAAGIGTVLSAASAAVGWFLRDLRDQVRDLEEDVEKNAEFRRVMTGENLDAHTGELPEIDESFGAITEEIETLRHEQAKEYRKVWSALSAIHTSIDRLVDAVNKNDEIEAEVERPDHPFEYRGGEGGSDDD